MEDLAQQDVLTAYDRTIEELASRLTAKERRFVEIWKFGRVAPKVAMREAGYSDSTIKKQGPKWLLRRPHVAAYVDALGADKLDTILGSIKSQFLRLEYSVGVALQTLTDLSRDAQSESVRASASAKIVDLAKGILLASMPERSVDFTQLMSEIYKEAVKARERQEQHVVDVTPGDDSADDN